MQHDEPYMAHVSPRKSGEIVWTFNRAGGQSMSIMNRRQALVQLLGADRLLAIHAIRAVPRAHGQALLVAV